MKQCIRCENDIKGEFYEGTNGTFCKKCLKELTVYRDLKSMGLIKKNANAQRAER